MFEVFQNYITEKIDLTLEEIDLIKSVSIIKKLRKNQFLLQEGDVWRYNAFVCNGFIRKFSINDNGDEQTLSFAIENWWIGDRESLMNETPSKFNIDAIEDSVIILITKDNFARISKEIPKFNDMVNLILEKSFISHQSRLQSAINFTAEEKYRYFIEKYPQIASRSPSNMLASYLGMAKETLSRIRKKYNTKK